MVSIFSFLKSSPKLIDNVFDKDKGLLTQVGSWIGNANFTDEERSELNVEMAKAIQAYSIATMDENTDRSMARREIAVLSIQVFWLMVFMCGITYKIDPEWSKIWFELSTSYTVAGLITSISVFFFGGHALVKHNNTKKN